MKDSRVVIGQVGCGYWGPVLLRSFSGLEGARVKWVAEMSETRRDFVLEKYPATQVTESVEDILNDLEVEAVLIASPAVTHADLAIRCLNAGKHVFVEKPLATNVEDVDRIAAAALANGKVVMAGHTFLYNEAVRYVKSAIDSGELGEIYYVYSQRLNLGQVRTDVNAWWNLAPHDISVLLYWLKDVAPDEIEATGASYLRPDIEDVVFANLHWASGVVGHVHVSWLDPQKVRRMILVGSKKMLVYDDMADDKVTLLDRGYDKVPQIGDRMDFDQPNPLALVQRSGEASVPTIPWKEPLKTEAQHFIDCIRSGQTPISGIDHAREVVRILQVADENLRSKRRR